MKLSVTSVLPYFLVSAVLLATAWGIARRSPFYRQVLDAELGSERFHAIDGLRGFLALAVFFHHAVVSYFYYQNGQWEMPPSRFYALLGQVGVALFFMITGFLFWTKGLQLGPKLRVQTMLWSRVCRLAPMYLASIGIVFMAAMVFTGFELRQEPIKFIAQGLSWVSFGFVEPMAINGFGESWMLNAGVQWSLCYEWMFYLFLPLGLLFARGWSFVFLVLVIAAYIYKFSVRGVEWNFVFGALAAVVVSYKDLLPVGYWKKGVVGVFAIGALGVVFSSFDKGYGLLQSCLLFGTFVCIANGNDLFGILSSRAARFLGAVSYSIYLMHGIVLFVILRIVNRVVPIAGLSAGEYWLLIAVCGAVLVVVCALTYRTIEHPLMKLPMPNGLRGTPFVEAPRPEARGVAGRVGE